LINILAPNHERYTLSDVDQNWIHS